MSPGLPPAAAAAALASFPQMSVHRLLALLRHHPPAEAFAVAAGTHPPRPGTLAERALADERVREAWARAARTTTPERVWERCLALELEVSVVGQPEHPAAFRHDPLPPAVLFSRGDRTLLDGRRVGLVGTRNATALGRHIARELGAGLAGAGVHVVSGLARGIDAEAHGGTLSRPAAPGRPIGVVASGHDVVYPREHRRLWCQVGETGLLLSESPPGTDPAAHRFPLRNRLIAAASEVLVVVESRERGGSLVTAALAAERGVPVMAVPGSAANRAASGTNALLRDGSPPALDLADVLTALAIDHGRTPPMIVDQRIRPRTGDLACYRVCQAGAATIGAVAERTGLPLLEVAMALARLELGGWLAQVDGWFEVVGAPLP